MKFIVSIFLLCLLSTSTHAAVEVQINQLQFSYPEPVRLAKVLEPISASSDWYWPASAIYRTDDDSAEQLRTQLLKQIADLKAEREPADRLYQALSKIEEQVNAWTLATRVVRTINYDAARLDPKQNPQLNEGRYMIRLMPRPDSVHLSGAVMRAGSYQHKSQVSTPAYLASISMLDVAEPDYVYVIRPSGEIMRVGIAYWNGTYNQLMPGSQVIVPVFSTIFSPSLAKVNESLAQLAVHRVLP
ncbi:capsule biosynthesis GfcC family protein [Alteromonas sp. H39]|uniref:capsule biosynthesis GfcC family protein n=1 Tax=Alteromonas sp. H39 TaxID=3389876 RepID=UPI0039E17585